MSETLSVNKIDLYLLPTNTKETTTQNPNETRSIQVPRFFVFLSIKSHRHIISKMLIRGRKVFVNVHAVVFFVGSGVVVVFAGFLGIHV